MRDMFINILLLLSNFCLIRCTDTETDTTSNQNNYSKYLTKDSRSKSMNHNQFIRNNNLKRKTCETAEAEVNSDKEKNAFDTNQNNKLQSLKKAKEKFTPDKNEFFDRFYPPTIVFSDDKKYFMWHRATNVFNTICKKYFEFTQISYLNFDECEYLKSIESVESADLFYSNFVSFLYSKEEGFFPKSVYDTKSDMLKGLYENISVDKLMLDNAMNQLNSCIYYFSKDLDWRFLTEILLFKIYLNKVKLVEIKSIILIIFYYYPTELEESKKPEKSVENRRIIRLKFLIAKTISLIDIANIFLRKIHKS